MGGMGQGGNPFAVNAENMDSSHPLLGKTDRLIG